MQFVLLRKQTASALSTATPTATVIAELAAQSDLLFLPQVTELLSLSSVCLTHKASQLKPAVRIPIAISITQPDPTFGVLALLLNLHQN
jgi:hypothetical protein